MWDFQQNYSLGNGMCNHRIILSGSQWKLTLTLLGQKGATIGGSLSPGFFVLHLEHLSVLMKQKTDNSKFNYHPKCVELKITHLTFADNLILMSRGDCTSVGILLQ